MRQKVTKAPSAGRLPARIDVTQLSSAPYPFRARSTSMPAFFAASRQCVQKHPTVAGFPLPPWLAPMALFSGPCRSLPHINPSTS